jgi:hypothetical protein
MLGFKTEVSGLSLLCYNLNTIRKLNKRCHSGKLIGPELGAKKITYVSIIFLPEFMGHHNIKRITAFIENSNKSESHLRKDFKIFFNNIEFFKIIVKNKHNER